MAFLSTKTPEDRARLMRLLGDVAVPAAAGLGTLAGGAIGSQFAGVGALPGMGIGGSLGGAAGTAAQMGLHAMADDQTRGRDEEELAKQQRLANVIAAMGAV